MNTATGSKCVWLQTNNGERIPLRGHVSLGRSRTNTVPINCEKVSRRHALIHQDEEGQCLVIDLGSSNGTYVNGSRITHLAHLTPGDNVEVGTHSYTLCMQEDEPRGMDMVKDDEATALGAQLVPTWIIVGDRETPRAMGEARNSGETYKTAVNWSQVCQRIVERHEAATPADFEDKLFAYWRDPTRDATVADCVAKALRELQAVQVRQRMEFRLALHFGTVVIGSSGPRRKKSLIGTEVTFAFQMQRLAWVLSSPCLISEDANRRILPMLPTRALEPCGLQSYQGDRQFFSL